MVTVNSDETNLQGWQVALTFDQAPVIINSWNANLETSGSTVTASNMPWNGFLMAGETTGFGLQGTYEGEFTKPGCEVISATSDDDTDSGQAATAKAKSSSKLLSQSGNPVHKRYENQRKAWSQSKADIVMSYQFDNGGW